MWGRHLASLSSCRARSPLTHVCFPHLWPPPSRSQVHPQPHAYLGGWRAANRKEGDQEGTKGSSEEGTLPKAHTPLLVIENSGLTRQLLEE